MKANEIKDYANKQMKIWLDQSIIDAQVRDCSMTADEKRAEIIAWQWSQYHEFPYSAPPKPKKIYPTIIDHAEVFDSEGTLALMSGGSDILYLSVADHQIDPLEHQKVIDIICEALVLNEGKK